MHRAYRTGKDKLGVIGWGISVSEKIDQGCNQKQNSNGFQTRPLTILCVGRLGSHKGQRWLLKVYLTARKQFARPVRIVLVGRDEGAASEIERFIDRHRIQDEVLVTGEVSDSTLAEWYAESDLFALFSQYEAFGLVFLEAMAHGTPVLTHDAGANREVLLKGAVVVPRYDEKSAVAELVRLVNDSRARRQLGDEAQEYALSEFAWPVVAKKYLEVYQCPRAAA